MTEHWPGKRLYDPATGQTVIYQQPHGSNEHIVKPANGSSRTKRITTDQADKMRDTR